MDEKLKPVYEAILDGDMGGATEGVQNALDAGITAADLLHKALIPAMGEVGRLFEEGEYFVPEMLIAARAMKAGLEILKPLLVDSGIEPVGTVAIGTVKGDLHDIGKNLVAMMMEGAGFEIMDLGTDVAPEKFVEAAQNGADIIGLSALLTTTMLGQKRFIEILKEKNLYDRFKVLVGGAPVNQKWADDIGADGYGENAMLAVQAAKNLAAAK